MFVDLSRRDQIDVTTVEHLRRHVRHNADRLARVLGGTAKAWSDLYFLPAHGFPEVTGLLLQSGASMRAPVPATSGLSGIRIDLAIEPASTGSAVVRLGNEQVELSWSDSTLRATHNGTASTTKASMVVSVTLARPSPGASPSLIVSAADGSLDFVPRDQEVGSEHDVRLIDGRAHLLQLQGWCESGSVFYSPEPGDHNSEAVARCSPRFLREWEERARRLWHFMIGVTSTLEAIEQRSDLTDANAKLGDDCVVAARQVLAALEAAPYWRPATGQNRLDGPWERGNWASGFLMGAFGLATYVARNALGGRRKRRLRGILLRRGIAFLEAPEREQPLPTDFPSIEHWAHRSTNHGVVVLASALVGARTAAKVLSLSGASSQIDSIEERFHQLMARAFEDGCYPEGIRYAQFCLQEALAFFLIDYHGGEISWEEYIREAAPYLPSVADYVRLSGTPTSDEPFAIWGDCPRSPWKQSVLHLLARSGGDGARDVATWLRSPATAKPDPSRIRGEKLKSEPLLAAVAALCPPPRAQPQSGTQLRTRCYKRAGHVAIAGQTPDARGDWGFWLLGSRIHKTHNVDHDLGSVFIQIGDVTWVGEVAGRHMASHSTIGLKGVALADPDDPFSFAGSWAGGAAQPRGYTGSVSLTSGRELPIVATLRADDGMYDIDGARPIKEYRVDAVLLAVRPLALLVVRRAWVDADHVPFHQLVFPSMRPTDEREIEWGRAYRFKGIGEVQLLHPRDGGAERSILEIKGASGSSRLVEEYPNPPGRVDSVQLFTAEGASWVAEAEVEGVLPRFRHVWLCGPGEDDNWTVSLGADFGDIEVERGRRTDPEVRSVASGPGRRMSVTANTPTQLPFAVTAEPRSFRCDNPLVEVDDEGVVLMREQAAGALGRAVVEVIDAEGAVRESVPVTVVPWRTDGPRLDVERELGAISIVGYHRGRVLFCDERSLYATSDGFRSARRLSDLPRGQRYSSDLSAIIETPVGFFLRTDSAILRSPDLENWRVEMHMAARGMWLNLCARTDPETGGTQVFTGEYSVDSTYRHTVFRGDYRGNAPGAWRAVMTFHAAEDGRSDPRLFPCARHIHLTTVDPHTGWLWVAAGDADRESAIYVSRDGGQTFEVFAIGSQEYRTLAIWFTERYVYWNMDTHKLDQKIARAPRSGFQRDGALRPLTPILREGDWTVPGRRYYALFGDRAAGKEIVETEARPVGDAALVALDDPDYNVRQEVANLGYGSQWYHLPVVDSAGTRWIAMSASPESLVPGTTEAPYRDWNARLFVLRETEGDGFEAFEVYTAEPDPDARDDKQRSYNRIDPRCQDDDGVLYLMAHNSILKGALKARLIAPR